MGTSNRMAVLSSVASNGLVSSSDRKIWWLNNGILVAGLFTVLMVLAPLFVIVLSWGSDQTDIWQHLIETQLSSLLRNTLVLVLGVGIGVSVLGVSLAWLTVMCSFPGRRWFDWLLILPMSMPAYVLAFVTLGVFDFGGPLQSQLAQLFGSSYQFVDVRSEFTVIAVLTLVLYPYVYLLARSAFMAQSSDMIEAARILGATQWGAFFKVALPMARPAIVAGVSLAIMETLADFGTVAVFNYDTFTTAIYKSWFGFFSLQAAAQLASLLLLFVAMALLGEKYSRGRRGYTQTAKLHHRNRIALSKPAAYAATGFCLLVLSIAFFLPVMQLLQWVLIDGLSAINRRYIDLLWHTLLLGCLAALLTVTLALLISYSRRVVTGTLSKAFDVATLGYALPGSVLAVGVMLSFTFIEQQMLAPVFALFGIELKQFLVGSVLALLAAYWVRFLAVAAGPVDAGFDRINRSIPEAARSLGANGWQVIWRVYLPILRPGVLTALVLVFVDVMKEMPATLLLRPFGWDTLAVRIYEMTSEGEWERAALPALTLIVVGLLPVAQALKQSVIRH